MARLYPNSFFPCAWGVTMPQLGVADAKTQKHLFRMQAADALELRPESDDSTPVDKHYLKKISADIRFTEDVIKERCFFAMPYDPKYLKEALNISDLFEKRLKVHYGGRHNAKGPDLHHTICGLKITKPPRSLKPLKKKHAQRALEMADKAKETPESSQDTESIVKDKKTEKPAVANKAPATFLTEVSPTEIPNTTLLSLQGTLKALKEAAAAEAEDAKRSKSAWIRTDAEKQKKDWDTYLISQLSQVTATWIVHERTSPITTQYELKKTLQGWYGKPLCTDLLIEDDKSDTEEKVDPFDKKQRKVKVKKKWKKDEETLLERVYELPAMKPKAIDPYCDENKAPLYRQPAGIRKQKKNDLKAVSDATIHPIEVKTVKPPKSPTLRDFMSPRVGKTLYDTQNQYEQELLTGVKQLHPSTGVDSSVLVMESNKKYKKQLRQDYPDAAQKWYPLTEEEKKAIAKHPPIRCEKGAKRWEGLPELYDDTFEAQKVVPPGYAPEFNRAGDPTAKRQAQQNSTLLQILQEWRSKWNLTSQYADATFEDIIRDMADIQPHVRLKAITTVGKAAEYKSPVDAGAISIDNGDSKIPKHVFVALDCLLGDTNDKVRRAAAITLYALGHPTEKAKKVLQKLLASEASVERWAAAQCLAHYGVGDSQVVDEIIKQILFSEEPIKHEQGIALLAKISNNTTLVHGMVAEQLNSSSWRHRVIACKILPTLHGTINKDVTQKLTEMMWHDWHTEVRKAAAQCLGKTSHGRDVHDDLKRCIMYGSERVKLEAISRLGQLGIMTTKMLPAFLECFKDEYVSIRSECCITCGNLQIQEESVIKKLVYLATFDPIWKVKAHAMQALGKIGVQTTAIKDCLLWAMRYEEKAGVRAEACHSLRVLCIIDDDVMQITRERLLVETSQVVRDEMIEMLQLAGLNATEDMEMVTQIKGAVRKLCTRNIIASHIVLNEADEIRRQNLTNMIYISQEEIELKEDKDGELHKYRTHFKLEESDSTTTLSPEPVSREATFTSLPDKELEGILDNEDGERSCQSSMKSRPVTSQTDATVGTYSSAETTEHTSQHSFPDDYVDERDRHLESNASDSVQFRALTPGKSRLGLVPSDSLINLKGKQGDGSVSTFPSRLSMASRDTLKEHHKHKENRNTVFQELEMRYSLMANEINEIDFGPCVGSPVQKVAKFLELPPHRLTKSVSTPAVIDAGFGVNMIAKSKSSSIFQDGRSMSENPLMSDEINKNHNQTASPEDRDEGQVAFSLQVPETGVDYSSGCPSVGIEEQPSELSALKPDDSLDGVQSSQASQHLL